MILQSLITGPSLLLHWQPLVAVLLYVSFILILLIILDALASRGSSLTLACAKLKPVIQGLALGVMIFWLLPFFIGRDEAMPLSSIHMFAGPLIRASLVAAIVMLIISLIPILGPLLDLTPGFDTFITGLIIYRVFAGPFLASAMARNGVTVSIYPGISLTLFYAMLAIILSLVFAWIASLLSSLMGVAVGKDRSGSIDFILVRGITVLSGLLPLFMYSQYALLNLKRLIGG